MWSGQFHTTTVSVMRKLWPILWQSYDLIKRRLLDTEYILVSTQIFQYITFFLNAQHSQLQGFTHKCRPSQWDHVPALIPLKLSHPNPSHVYIYNNQIQIKVKNSHINHFTIQNAIIIKSIIHRKYKWHQIS